MKSSKIDSEITVDACRLQATLHRIHVEQVCSTKYPLLPYMPCVKSWLNYVHTQVMEELEKLKPVKFYKFTY